MYACLLDARQDGFVNGFLIRNRTELNAMQSKEKDLNEGFRQQLGH